MHCLSFVAAPSALLVVLGTTGCEAVSHPEGSQCLFGCEGLNEASCRKTVGPCDDGLACAIYGFLGDGKCHALGQLDEACGIGCARGLVCDGATCRAPPGEGQACIAGVCGAGLYCDVAHQCSKARQLGEGCGALVCDVGLFCDAAGVCEAKLDAQGACLVDVACAGARVCNYGATDGRSGLCLAPSRVGGPCAWRSVYRVNAWYPEEHGCELGLVCVPEAIDPLAAGEDPPIGCGVDLGCWNRGTCQEPLSQVAGATCNGEDDCQSELVCVQPARPQVVVWRPGFDRDLLDWRGAWPGHCRASGGRGEGAACGSGACWPDFYCSAINDGQCMGAHRVGEGGSCRTGDGQVDGRACALDLTCRLDASGQEHCER